MHAKKQVKAFITLLTVGCLLFACIFCACSHVHTPEYVEAKAATCTESGLEAHYACTQCGKTFVDKAATVPKEIVYVSPRAHKYLLGYAYDGQAHYKMCGVCGYKDISGGQRHIIDYHADAATHYEYCYCGYKGETQAHVFKADGVPCSVCLYGNLLYSLSEDKSYYICAGASDAYKEGVREIEIPDTYKGLPVKEIGARAFSSCENLTSVTLGKNIVTLGDYAFHNCPALTDVKLNDGLMEIDSAAFDDCVALEKIQFPSSLIRLGNRIFYGCVSLKDAEFGAGITTLPAHTFFGCKSLDKIKIGGRVNNIETAAFSGTPVTELVIPDGVKEIPMTMCLDCVSLTSVTIPASVKSIGAAAFSGCKNLTKIIFLGTRAQWDKISFGTYPQAWNFGVANYTVICKGE